MSRTARRGSRAGDEGHTVGLVFDIPEAGCRDPSDEYDSAELVQHGIHLSHRVCLRRSALSRVSVRRALAGWRTQNGGLHRPAAYLAGINGDINTPSNVSPSDARTASGRLPTVSRFLFGISLPGLGLTRFLPLKVGTRLQTGIGAYEKVRPESLIH